MNRQMNNRRAVALIIVLAFLLIAAISVITILVLSQGQQGITRSLMQLDEIRYAEETGMRHGFWVWRYKYSDPLYLDNGTLIYQITLAINGYNVDSVDVQVEDKNMNRKLEQGEIEIQVNKINWSL